MYLIDQASIKTPGKLIFFSFRCIADLYFMAAFLFLMIRFAPSAASPVVAY